MLIADAEPQPWMVEAHSLLGTAEDTSDAVNPVITGWAGPLGIDYADDEVPWCGLFVAHCIGSRLPAEPRPKNPLGARSWSRFGVACPPQPGAVMVFWRGSRSGWLGHVAFYVGEDDRAFHVLGGNQSDRVGVTRMPKGRLLAARWPATFAAPAGGALILDASGALSVNEA
jgi:uncharacterized protein (TIGR02594 family)